MVMSKPGSPQIRVHYIKPAQSVKVNRAVSKKQIKPKQRWWLSTLLMATLIIGLGSGAYLSWSSHLGQAEPQGQVAGAATEEPSIVIPLDYDQSELTVVADLLPVLLEQNRHEPTPAEIVANARKQALKDYLTFRKSPLAEDDGALEALLRSRNMKMMLAISFVESNMCKRQVYFNCSGIGGSKIRQYENFAGWIDDFDSLLERRYKGLAVEDFIGYYVQPGSQNWVDGVYQILDELKDRRIE